MDFKEQQERRRIKKRAEVDALIAESKAKYDKLSDSDKAKVDNATYDIVACDCTKDHLEGNDSFFDGVEAKKYCDTHGIVITFHGPANDGTSRYMWRLLDKSGQNLGYLMTSKKGIVGSHFKNPWSYDFDYMHVHSCFDKKEAPATEYYHNQRKKKIAG
tara:strand:+ start:567 stop:1043 length:477 start_codon:yes stop_codon:yes gene_type:complete